MWMDGEPVYDMHILLGLHSLTSTDETNDYYELNMKLGPSVSTVLEWQATQCKQVYHK